MFFKKKRKGDALKDLNVKVDEVYVATSIFRASVNEGKGFCDKKVKIFYLVTKVQYGYKDLFSGRDLVLDEEEEFLDIPFIQKVEPLRNYLVDDTQSEISYTALFDLIATINVMDKLGNFEQTKKGRRKQCK